MMFYSIEEITNVSKSVALFWVTISRDDAWLDYTKRIIRANRASVGAVLRKKNEYRIQVVADRQRAQDVWCMIEADLDVYMRADLNMQETFGPFIENLDMEGLN